MAAAYNPGLPGVEPQRRADALREARWPSVFDYRGYEIPFEQPTRTQLVINTSTATALRLTIPTTLRPRADELVS